MAIRDEAILLKLTEEEKTKYSEAAQAREMTVVGFLREAADFYLSFPLEFLQAVKISADPLKMSIPTVIVYLLNYYLAQESAFLEFFKTTQTFKRAFQYNEAGLLNTDEIADRVQNEIRDRLKELIQKIQKAKKTGKRTELNLEETMLMAQKM